MSRRPSVFVLALTVGDYLLWNWSLNGNHDVLALVSGLTLPPLALISFWVLAIGAMRTLAAAPKVLRGRRAGGARAASAAERARTRTAAAGAARAAPSTQAASTAAAEASRRIAA